MISMTKVSLIFLFCLYHFSTFASDSKVDLAIALQQIHPTQFEVGPPRIKSLAARFEKSSLKKIQRYLDKRPFPFILGPDQKKYIIDRHHLAYALDKYVADKKITTLTITFEQKEDLSRLNKDLFWQKMKEKNYVHPKSLGKELPFDQIPDHVSKLKVDYYRGLVWVMIQADVIKKSPIPFAEFSWADQLRVDFPQAQSLSQTPDKFLEELYLVLQKNATTYSQLAGHRTVPKDVQTFKKAFSKHLTFL
jgi:hypothetical protein